jgi:hypothetical protein
VLVLATLAGHWAVPPASLAAGITLAARELGQPLIARDGSSP